MIFPPSKVINIATRDIYCLARWSSSSKSKGRLTSMRSPNCDFDNDDVLCDVDAK